MPGLCGRTPLGARPGVHQTIPGGAWLSQHGTCQTFVSELASVGVAQVGTRFFNACALQSNHSCKHHKRLTPHFHLKENVISQVKSKPSIGLQVSVLYSSAWRDDN
jgi:hypothetical protein